MSEGGEPWSKQPSALQVHGQYGEIRVENDGGQRKSFEKIEGRGSCRK
jgi:hypothetical protein